jgi:alkanesulfonate monooxygenase SsuD/methylene tetrahydromethanopterin reductase-like flavin-dependent oxidoreductase (luciferase family)
MAETGVAVEQIQLSLDEVLDRASLVDKLGVSGVWLAQFPNQRETSIVAAGLAGAFHSGTVAAFLPVYTRPPVVMAQTAMTLDELCGNRLILSLGLGLRIVGDWMVGGTAGPPLESMREYLTIVTSLVREGEVDYTGKWHSGHASYSAPRRAGLPVYLGSFGPKMLQLAGEFADGVMVWMCGPEYVRSDVLPNVRIGRARRGLDLDGFKVVQMLPAIASSDPADGRSELRRYLTSYLRVPTYRRLFEACGFGECVRTGQPSDALAEQVGAFGTERDIRRRIAQFHEAGSTQVAISPVMGAHVDRQRFLDTVAAAG